MRADVDFGICGQTTRLISRQIYGHVSQVSSDRSLTRHQLNKHERRGYWYHVFFWLRNGKTTISALLFSSSRRIIVHGLLCESRVVPMETFEVYVPSIEQDKHACCMSLRHEQRFALNVTSISFSISPRWWRDRATLSQAVNNFLLLSLLSQERRLSSMPPPSLLHIYVYYSY
ncbi:hypothetical protein M405DRAFT_837568 [Rhizopogon salebrosus TDB-379]|nr:hypothetical protein M405DRAFT_837568 [Rhizopogon salebrosus TDB-379]